MVLQEEVKIFKVFEFWIYPQYRKLGNLGKFSLTSNFGSGCNLRCKNNKKLTETKAWRPSYTSRRKLENFRDFRIFSFDLYQNQKLENLGNCSFTSNFDCSCNLSCKNDKKLNETKT